MAYGLPEHGDPNWDTKLNNSIAAVKETADAALPAGQKGAASGVAPLDGDSRVPQANLPAHLDPDALTASFAPIAGGRRFVTFGDSWCTTIDGVNIPATAIAALGGTWVANHAIAGSQIAPPWYDAGGGWDPANTTGAQVVTATADTTYDKSLITDVLVLAGVNNIGGYLPTVTEARDNFAAIGALYPNARKWYVANSKKAIYQASDGDPWRWYSRFFQGAGLAGFAGATYSPLWHWGSDHASYWDVAALGTDRHMIAAGQTAWARRLAAFLSGEGDWRPHFRPTLTITSAATTLGAAIAVDTSYIDGTTLEINVVVTCPDVSGQGPTQILQIPADYAPPGDYMLYPAGRYVSATGEIRPDYMFSVEGYGEVKVPGGLLNDQEAFFTIRASIPLNTIRAA